MMHKPDEFVSIQDLEKVYLFYKGVIEENR